MSAIADSVTSIAQSGDAWQLAVTGVSGPMDLEAAMWPTGCPLGVEIVESSIGVFDIHGLTPAVMSAMDPDLNARFAGAGLFQHVMGSPASSTAAPQSTGSPDLANLLAWSKEELKGAGNVGSLAAYTPGDWEEYSFTERTIDSYVQLSAAGETVDSAEWHRALTALGEARNILASNAEVAIRQRIADRTAHLAAEKRDLENAQHALEDVEKAEQDAQRAEHAALWVERMKKLSEIVELVEAAHEPSAEKILQMANMASTVHMDFEGFVKAEGQYFVQVTLASHGFGSAEELARRIQTAAANVSEAANALHTEVYAYDLAKYYHAQPIHH